ncbi:MAG: preprotein translocase subunit SecG [Tissierella sp.]|uniref:preprotein translocase subunit SecG n=1 Tax=Tissierella sp. TaxID=41274 RepID=UPI003F9E58D4
MQMFFSVLLLVSALAVIISVLLQEGSGGGLGASMGGSSAPASMWGKSGGKTKESILQKATMISAAIFIISALVLAAK